ncbi:MAG: DUF1189 domain-containing protein [Clostridia bacterium]|nr:DUF1189 domain-containing protein [Clostridia bacterium]
MEEVNTNFFTKAVKSISDFGYYKNLIKQSVGKSISYLLLLCLILGTISMIRPVLEFNRGISTFISAFEKNIPEFVLENGELNVSGPMPVTTEEDGAIFIIDTSGRTGVEALNNYDNGMLVLKDKMIQKNLGNIQTTEFSSLAGLKLTKSDIGQWLPFLKFISVFIVLFGLIVFIIGKLLSALLISIIGLLLNAIVSAGLTFKDIFKMAVYSLTLPIILKVILSAAAINVPFFWLVYYLIAVFYVGYAMTLIKKENQITFE